ncbi:MAG: hypothetical protein GX096_04600 [Clostridiales bacterium]|nr:hypothetical protein [Clostridiales bacterium]
MELIYGTANEAKLATMCKCATDCALEIIGLDTIPAIRDVQIEEGGADPLENAIIKAKAFYQALGRPVFSCDSGLFCENLPAELQPGVHVRRVNEKTMTDAEMVAYYSGLAKEYGMLKARYQNAICLIMDDEHLYASMDASFSSKNFGIVDTPHPNYAKGFPLDCLSVRLSDGTYYLDDEHSAPEDESETKDIAFGEVEKRAIIYLEKCIAEYQAL